MDDGGEFAAESGRGGDAGVGMGKRKKFYDKIMSGQSDGDIDFKKLLRLLEYLEFSARTHGSHHVFNKTGIKEHLDLQPVKNLAKEYQ